MLKNNRTLIDKLLEFGPADRYFGGDIIYKVQDYAEGKTPDGIYVADFDTGEICGVVYKKDPNSVYWKDELGNFIRDN